MRPLGSQQQQDPGDDSQHSRQEVQAWKTQSQSHQTTQDEVNSSQLNSQFLVELHGLLLWQSRIVVTTVDYAVLGP